MHGFLFINKRLLISCDTGIYAIMIIDGPNGHFRLFLLYMYVYTFYSLLYGENGVYRGELVFLFLIQYIDCGYWLELPLQGGSNMYPQSMLRG